MKVIIAGSRQIDDLPMLQEAIGQSGFTITEIVSGGSGGVDINALAWAKITRLPSKTFMADWSRGRKGGPMRNREMADYADALIAIWDGESRGTLDMMNQMKKAKKPVYLYRVERRQKS